MRLIGIRNDHIQLGFEAYFFKFLVIRKLEKS
jgi:hypothetical protein